MKKPLIIMLMAIMLLAVSGCNSNIHKVEKMIDNIGEIEPTLKCKNTLDKVSATYNALSDEQKEQVSNAVDLELAEISFRKKKNMQKMIVNYPELLKKGADLCGGICSFRKFIIGDFTQSSDDPTLANSIEELKQGHQTIIDTLSMLDALIKTEDEQREIYYMLELLNEGYTPLYELTINPPSSYDEYSSEFKGRKAIFDLRYNVVEKAVSPIRAQYEELNATNQTTN